MAVLVDKNKLTQDTLVQDVLPSFHSKGERIWNHLTITDLSSID